MKHLVKWEDILRQQAAPLVAGRTWEEPVAVLERMQAARKRSGWPGMTSKTARPSARRAR